MTRIFLFLIVAILAPGCDIQNQNRQPKTTLTEEEIELRRQEKKHRVKTIADFLYEILLRTTDQGEINRIHRTLACYFVDHYPEAMSALAEAGVDIYDLLRVRNNKLTNPRNTKDSAKKETLELQDRVNQCESQSEKLSAAYDYIKSLKDPLKRKIISEFFDEIIQSLPPLLTASDADISNRVAIVRLMTSCFANSYPKPLSYLFQDGQKKSETYIIAKFLDKIILKDTNRKHTDVIYKIMMKYFIQSYPEAGISICKTTVFSNYYRKKNASGNNKDSSNNEQTQKLENEMNQETEYKAEIIADFFNKVLLNASAEQLEPIRDVMNFYDSSRESERQTADSKNRDQPRSDLETRMRKLSPHYCVVTVSNFSQKTLQQSENTENSDQPQSNSETENPILKTYDNVPDFSNSSKEKASNL